MNSTPELGYFGNIWVRQNYLENVGDSHPGHKQFNPPRSDDANHAGHDLKTK